MSRHLIDEKKLNHEQLEAVKHKSGPLLIIAGAGTGKTTVITERVKYLILGGHAKPSEILALTFTEKAAREMEERIDMAMPFGYTQMWVSTFHSFCDRILKREALHIGLNPNYKLLSEAESIQLIRKHLFELDLDYFRPLGTPNKFISGMLQHFSRLQDEDVSPGDYVNWVKAQSSKLKAKNHNSKPENEDEIELQKWEELAHAYQKYDELKTKNGLMDFGDLISKTLKLFRERPNVLKEYQNQFKYILIDEFQDTNFAQNELAILLSKKSKNITVVGDDDQSIYRFRGAAVSNIIQFRKNFPKTKVVVLTKNYRSTQEILDRSYQLIQNNNPDRLEVVEDINKKLTTQRSGKGEEIVLIHSDRVENEATRIAEEIVKLKNEENYSWSEFAILVRANTHSEPIGRALGRAGIPFQFLGPGRLFKQSEIIDLISYLKVLYNFEDSISFYRLISQDHFDIAARDIAAISNHARRYKTSLFEVCEPENLNELLSTRKIMSDSFEKITKLVSIIHKHLRLIKSETAGQLLYNFLEETEMLPSLLNPQDVNAEKKAKNISKLFDKLKTFETDHESADVFSVVDWLDLKYELGESPLAADTDWGNIDAVNILTIHSAKGLEFPVVFMVNLVAQRFPTIERREQIPIPEGLIKEILPIGDYHLQEERRLFYVGMTRAKDRLYFTAADFYGEGKREKRLSPFVFEALGREADRLQTRDFGKQLSFLEYQQSVASLPEVAVRQKAHIDYLSYSQIDTFKICPLHYKMKYILGVPTPTSAAMSFGISMHAAMKEFYECVRQKQKPTKKLILQCLKNVWGKEGFSSKLHRDGYFKKGENFLINYLENEFNDKVVPLVLEQPFTVPLRANNEPGVKNNGGFLKIGGKIDRVDDLGGGAIEIIDYKTGAAKSQKEIDKDMQLTFYTLAATSIAEPPFAKKPEEIKLTLYYFEGGKKLSTTRTKEDLLRATEEIFKVRDEIINSDFKCSGHMFCQSNCEYSMYCNEEVEN